jgi:alkylated DNA repair dioxygenase AlkB
VARSSIPLHVADADLFGPPGAPFSIAAALPQGLDYQADFLSPAQESQLIALVEALPLECAHYKGYTARRRVLAYGGSFDYDTNRLLPAQPLVEALLPLRARVAAWMGVPPEALVHALVAEYRPGTPLGWHRDVPDFEEIAGVSLGREAVLRFRPYPPGAPDTPGRIAMPRRQEPLCLAVAPRSLYRMRGAARWAWQHSVAPTPGLRWSITFRTAAGTAPRQ